MRNNIEGFIDVLGSVKFVTSITLISLICGILFSLGQSFVVGFEYLSTFGYADFIKYAILCIPFVLFLSYLYVMILQSRAFFTNYVVVMALIRSGLKTKRRWAMLVSFLIPYVVLLLVIVFFTRFYFLDERASIPNYYYLVFSGILIGLLVLMNRLSKSNSRYSDKFNELAVREAKKRISSFAKTNLALILYVSIIPIFGVLSVTLQEENSPTHIIEFQAKPHKELIGNILASNSSTIVIKSENTVMLISRDKIAKIKTLND